RGLRGGEQHHQQHDLLALPVRGGPRNRGQPHVGRRTAGRGRGRRQRHLHPQRGGRLRSGRPRRARRHRHPQDLRRLPALRPPCGFRRLLAHPQGHPRRSQRRIGRPRPARLRRHLLRGQEPASLIPL
ncbi:uncharacterized protein METZ01_LOCUS373047, partial [marine metagenome]